jgi:hypothetical protein
MTMQKQPPREATSGADWRKTREQGLEVEFPSGNVARLRNVPIAKLLMGGLISDTLTPIVHDMLSGSAGEKRLAKTPTPDVLAASIALKEAMCKEAFAYPRIVDTPTGNDEISIEDVAEEDQEFVMTLLYSSAERLAATFPPGSRANVPPVDKGQAVSQTSE